MAKFKAIRDGLVGTSYIRAGETFSLDADECPRWAEPVKEKAADDADASDNEGEEAEKASKPAKKAKGK